MDPTPIEGFSGRNNKTGKLNITRVQNQIKRVVSLLLLAALTLNGVALGIDKPAIAPTSGTITLESSILQEERTIRVHLPPAYGDSTKNHPVLYVLDAEQGDHFQKSVTMADTLARRDDIPGLIVVGIENTDRLRDTNVPVFEYQGQTIHGRATGFLNFLQHELLMNIDAMYRTSGFNILFGRSSSGTFTIYAMVSSASVFDAYIAASPSFFVNYDLITGQMPVFLASDNSSGKIFFMNLGTEDAMKRVTQTKALGNLLEQHAPDGFKWELRVMQGIGHVPESSLEDGLRMIFDQK